MIIGEMAVPRALRARGSLLPPPLSLDTFLTCANINGVRNTTHLPWLKAKIAAGD
jgi:hypothetical protein